MNRANLKLYRLKKNHVQVELNAHSAHQNSDVNSVHIHPAVLYFANHVIGL